MNPREQGRGRPPEGTDGGKRETRVEIRVSEGEAEAMTAAATARGLTLPQWLRSVAFRAAGVRENRPTRRK